MAITVGDLLTKVAYDLQEADNTFPSGLWTRAEMYNYINWAIGDFLNDTGIMMIDGTVVVVIGNRDYSRPATAGDIDRVSYNGKRLRRISAFDLASKDPAWRNKSGDPQFYHEDGISISSIQLDKLPTRAGTLRIFADLLHTDITDVGDALVLPDTWEPYIRWEVLSFALQKDGESQDLKRADWAHKKYQFGVSLAQRIVYGADSLGK